MNQSRAGRAYGERASCSGVSAPQRRADPRDVRASALSGTGARVRGWSRSRPMAPGRPPGSVGGRRAGSGHPGQGRGRPPGRVIHRDVKPGNVRLERGPGRFRATVGDVGLARPWDASGPPSSTRASGRIRAEPGAKAQDDGRQAFLEGRRRYASHKGGCVRSGLATAAPRPRRGPLGPTSAAPRRAHARKRGCSGNQPLGARICTNST
jgi:hypothetical protein